MKSLACGSKQWKRQEASSAPSTSHWVSSNYSTQLFISRTLSGGSAAGSRRAFDEFRERPQPFVTRFCHRSLETAQNIPPGFEVTST